MKVFNAVSIRVRVMRGEELRGHSNLSGVVAVKMAKKLNVPYEGVV